MLNILENSGTSADENFIGLKENSSKMSWCSYSSVSGIPYCPAQWPSASKQNQYPNHIWSSTAYKAYYAWRLDGTSWALNGFCATTNTNGNTHFGSVRCCFGFRIKIAKAV